MTSYSQQHKGRVEAARLLKQNAAAPVSKQQMGRIVNYLVFYGYVSISLLQNMDDAELKKGVRQFQRVFQLPVTGNLDEQTLRAMEQPRCGCPDQLDYANKQHLQFLRAQEVAANRQDRWNKKGLTYAIARYINNGMSQKTQQAIVAAAFKAWDDICGLTITLSRKTSTADIIVDTGRGPQNNFDGRGGTLAWAYVPTGSDNQLTMKFDLDETWVANSSQRGVQLLNVACHEFGHLLGLSHSKKPSALMAPYYNPFVATPQPNDDISRIQKLYGPNLAEVRHEIGQDTSAHRIVELRAGQTLLIKGL